MTWYNPLSWFGDNSGRKNSSDSNPRINRKGLEDTLDWIDKTQGDLVLYCANPQCERKEIFGNEIFYSPDFGEFYHDGDCGRLAVVHKTFTSGEIMFGNFETINRREAIDMIRKGKIKYMPLSPESNIRMHIEASYPPREKD